MPKEARNKFAKNVRSDPMKAPAGSGLAFDKTKGQHILKNPGILDKIIKAADIKQTDTVMEVGPGTGNLTMQMLPMCRKLVALELDGRMVAEVKKRAFTQGRTNLEVLEGDALRTIWPRFDVCVANLPYQISSPFTFKLLAHRPLFKCAVLMFQLEFAERLLADVGDNQYGRLALNAKLFVKVTRVCKVDKGSFNPPPLVDSMVVKIVPRDPPMQVNFREWDGLMRIVFCRKNKTLHANFNTKPVLKTLEDNYKTYCSLHGATPTGNFKELLFGVLKESGFSESRSAKLSMDQYFQLLLAFNQKGIHFVNVAHIKEGEQTATALPENFFIPETAAGDMDCE